MKTAWPQLTFPPDPTKKDPRYKRFSASIDRALALFESNSLQEWADYISFLGRLLRVTRQDSAWTERERC